MASGHATPEDVEADLAARLDAAYDEDGVDRSLIRTSLERTPTERVIELENLLNGLATTRWVKPPR